MLNQLRMSESYLGFLKGKTELQSGKIASCLDKTSNYEGKIMARKDAIIYYLRAGRYPKSVDETLNSGKVKKSYRLYADNYYMEITKTEYDFCNYLIDNNLVSENNVDRYIENENEEREKANRKREIEEEKERAAIEKNRQEKEEFKKWLMEEAKNCENKYPVEADLQRQIFVSMMGEFIYKERAYELIVCIKNIEKPLCRQELKDRLHYDNIASRKTFYHITGLRLPKTNKATIEFLDNVQKSDYIDTLEFKKRKQPKEKDNKLKEYQIRVINRETKEVEYHMVMGEPLNKYGLDSFIHKDSWGNYNITDRSCGVKLVGGKTRTEAMDNLKKIYIDLGKEKIQSEIDRCVSLFGLVPN